MKYIAATMIETRDEKKTNQRYIPQLIPIMKCMAATMESRTQEELTNNQCSDLLQDLLTPLKKKCMTATVEDRTQEKKMMTNSFSELPPDLLILLMKHMAVTVEDTIRCASVCRSWQASVLAVARDKCQKKAPLLLIQERGSPARLTLFSPLEKRYYKLECPQPLSEDACIVGSSHGWLAAYDPQDHEKIVRLINPLTGAHVSLPPFSSLILTPSPVEIQDPLQYRKLVHYKKIVWSACPTSSNCMAMAIFYRTATMAVAKPGDKSWQVVVRPKYSWCPLVDVVHFNGRFYVISGGGVIMVCDIQSQPPQSTNVGSVSFVQGINLSGLFVNTLVNFNTYLVEMHGKLLVVLQLRRRRISYPLHVEFVIFEVKEGERDLVPVDGLGGGRLFLSKLSSCGGDPATQNSGSEYMANCIWFRDWDKFHQVPLCRYCLDNDQFRFPCDRIRYSKLRWATWVELNVAQLGVKLLSLDL